MVMKNKDTVSAKDLLAFLETPGFRKSVRLPPGIHHVGGDGFDESKPYPQKRIDAVARACADALR